MNAKTSGGSHRRLAGIYVVLGVLTVIYFSHDLAKVSGLLLVGAGLLAWCVNTKSTRRSHRKETSGQQAPEARSSKHRLHWE